MDFENIFYDLVDLQLGEILENEPLYKHTTFKVGGPARLFIYIENIEALKRGIQYCREHQVKHMVIGRGSDLLFSDKEYEGVIFSLKNLNKVHFNGVEIRAQAGVSMIYLAYEAAKVGLSGFEFMGGIPGTIGGGVYMNAGAYKYCISDVFTSALILNEKGELMTLNREQMQFNYRQSILQKHKDIPGNEKRISEIESQLERMQDAWVLATSREKPSDIINKKGNNKYNL